MHCLDLKMNLHLRDLWVGGNTLKLYNKIRHYQCTFWIGINRDARAEMHDMYIPFLFSMALNQNQIFESVESLTILSRHTFSLWLSMDSVFKSMNIQNIMLEYVDLHRSFHKGSFVSCLFIWRWSMMVMVDGQAYQKVSIQ